MQCYLCGLTMMSQTFNVLESLRAAPDYSWEVYGLRRTMSFKRQLAGAARKKKKKCNFQIKTQNYMTSLFQLIDWYRMIHQTFTILANVETLQSDVIGKPHSLQIGLISLCSIIFHNSTVYKTQEHKLVIIQKIACWLSLSDFSFLYLRILLKV